MVKKGLPAFIAAVGSLAISVIALQVTISFGAYLIEDFRARGGTESEGRVISAGSNSRSPTGKEVTYEFMDATGTPRLHAKPVSWEYAENVKSGKSIRIRVENKSDGASLIEGEEAWTLSNISGGFALSGAIAILFALALIWVIRHRLLPSNKPDEHPKVVRPSP